MIEQSCDSTNACDCNNNWRADDWSGSSAGASGRPDYPTLGQIQHAALHEYTILYKRTAVEVRGDYASCTYTKKKMTRPGYKFECDIWNKASNGVATEKVTLQSGGSAKKGYFFSWYVTLD